MEFKINFWTVPDWNRESSINPNFMMVVAVALFVLTSLLWVRVAESRRMAVEQKHGSIQEELESIAARSEELYQIRAETELWQSKLDR